MPLAICEFEIHFAHLAVIRTSVRELTQVARNVARKNKNWFSRTHRPIVELTQRGGMVHAPRHVSSQDQAGLFGAPRCRP